MPEQVKPHRFVPKPRHAVFFVLWAATAYASITGFFSSNSGKGTKKRKREIMADPITYWPLGDGIGYVSLITHMGNDLSVVNAARVSYAKRSEQYTEKDGKLIAYLMRNKHMSPFEHVTFQFRVRAPLFVVHQWERHRAAAYNEESGRYVELRPDFYTPTHEHEGIGATPDEAIELLRQHWVDCFKLYQLLLAGGTAKELARIVLPASLYKEFWVSMNARSLMNFLVLRNEEHAQWEIRQYAIAMEKVFAYVTPGIHAAFIQHGRTAP